MSPFRESFLALFTEPDLQDALRRVGHAVYCWAHEYSYSFPEPPESLVAHELRAAGRELRWLEAYFGLYLGNQYQASDLDPADTRLSQLAEEIAPELGKLAAKIEAALPAAPVGDAE